VLVVKRVESAPFTLSYRHNQHTNIYKGRLRTHVDSHLLIIRQAQMLHLGDVSYSLHIRSVTACTEDDCNLRVGIDVVGGNESTSRVVN
jgi:hypothetical protein